jgi:hypothetical protein
MTNNVGEVVPPVTNVFLERCAGFKIGVPIRD